MMDYLSPICLKIFQYLLVLCDERPVKIDTDKLLEYFPEIKSIDNLLDNIRKLSKFEYIVLIYSLDNIYIAIGKKAKILESSLTKIFIVHGHDSELLAQVEAFLRKVELNPIIISEKPIGGRSIIEMIEKHGDVQFAVVLLTPDDKGGLNLARAKMSPRARQNVVLELGYFIGRLGRDRVQAIYRGKLELPSDIHGVIYNKVDIPSTDWRMVLTKDLKHAGIPLNESKIFE